MKGTDSLHDFDDNNVDDFVAQAAYFQKGTPFFHGLTEQHMTNKTKIENIPLVIIDLLLIMITSIIK